MCRPRQLTLFLDRPLPQPDHQPTILNEEGPFDIVFVDDLIQDNTVNQNNVESPTGIADAVDRRENETFGEPPVSPIRRLGDRLTFLDGLFSDLESMVIWGDEDQDDHAQDRERESPPDETDAEEEMALALLLSGLRLPTDGQLGAA